MDHAEDGDDGGVFIYMGGDQRVPRDVRHIRIHRSVKIITQFAFSGCMDLVSIEMHDDVEIIEQYAFYGCILFRGITLPGVRVIECEAFGYCEVLEHVEFGDKLERIEFRSFGGCISLRSIKIPKVRVIGNSAFDGCEQLTDVEFSKDLEGIEIEAFCDCPLLRRIAIPLKNNLLSDDVFYDCHALSHIDLVGGIHKTTSSLLLESWRNEMNNEIDRINRDLPNTPTDEKTAAIRRWMGRVIRRIKHYKSGHYVLLKNYMAQLELALWKANLNEKEELEEKKQPAKKAKLNEECLKDTSYIDVHADRQQARVTCGANIIIPHVLSFLNDDDVFPLLNQNA